MSPKYALVIGNTEYVDPGLSQLTAPSKDAEDFARVLRDPNICAFDEVKVLLNQVSSAVIEAIDEFFDQKKPDDLLVLFFSGHGVRDELGSLYLAVRNTIRSRLRSTAIKSDYIRDVMDQSRSRRQVLILDCCNSGAFAQGTKAEVGGTMGMVSAFQGYGRYVLTASDATQFAWEGNKVIGETDNSLFTHFLVKGLEGEADSNSDGKITVDELYDYAFEKIVSLTPKQKPNKSATRQEGEIVLRRVTRMADIKPIALPEDLISEIEDLRPYVREAAVQKLEKILKGKNLGQARSAKEALERIAADENTTRRVAQAATAILEWYHQAEQRALQEVEEQRLLAEQKAEQERIAKEESASMASQKAEEERSSREKVEADRKAKEEAERLQQNQAEREVARLKTEQAAREAAEKAERERAERNQRGVREVAARHNAERQTFDVALPRQVEKGVAQERGKSSKPYLLPVGIVGALVTAVCVLFAAIRFLPSVFGVATALPTGIQSPVATEPLATLQVPTSASESSTAHVTPSGIEAPNNLKSPNPTIFTHATSNLSINTLDPALSYDLSSGEIIQNTYETLVFLEGATTNKFVPQLAEAWDVSADGRTWIFRIRKGVKFHNGDELTPTDVAYSLQRGLLQGGTSSPQWLLAEPFLGAGNQDVAVLVDPNLIDNRDDLLKVDPTKLRSACEKIQSAIVADDAAGTVTMILAQSWAPFLATIGQPWGSIMDKRWVIQNNGWNGSCDTWQNFYAMQAADDPFSAIENGTGPFKLESFKPEEEVALVRNDSYWRGPAKLERVIIKYVAESTARAAAIQAGDVDTIDASSDIRSQLDAFVGERCDFNLQVNSLNGCVVIDNTRPLRVRLGRPDIYQNVMLYNFSLPQSDNPYIGSGSLDGNGVPSDFFADVHIRKAFAYCFDWDKYITKTYTGEALQSYQIALPGMPGYFPDFPHYSFDLGKCEEEFKASTLRSADGKSVWDTGFRVQLAYNQGNTSRQNMMENLSSNIRSINSKFRIETLGLPWETYLSAQRSRQLPVFAASWYSDIYDPWDLYQPYILGTFGLRQNLPSNITDQFQDILNRGLMEMDPTARANIYREANQLYYDQAIGIPITMTLSHSFEQRWVFGRAFNRAFQGTYYYSIYKQ